MTNTSDDVNYYALLGVSPDAPVATIKAAFKHLALRYHPDVYHGEDAEAHMRQLLLAYRTLSNPAERMAYDARRAGHELPQEEGPQRSPAQPPSSASVPREVPLHARRDRNRSYAFPDLNAGAALRFILGKISYDLSPQEAQTLQQQGFLRGVAPEATGTLPEDVLVFTPHACHRCQHRWIPAEGGERRTRLWELICPSCKANDWGVYLLLRCVHCCAVFESEQIRDPLGPAAGKLFTPYDLFPLCPCCGTARWCPGEESRLEAIRRQPPRRYNLVRRRS
jgi:hypothetical protein